MSLTGQSQGRRSRWEEVRRKASLARLVSEGDRRFQYTLIQVPTEVLLTQQDTLDGSSLRCLHVPENAEVRLDEARPGFLERFAQLADATDDAAFQRFAKTWGLVGFCWHDLPASHLPVTTLGALSGDPWEMACRALAYEPVWLWRQFAEEACALLAIAARLHQGELGRTQDWHIARRRFAVAGEEAAKLPQGWAGLDGEWFVLGQLLEAWLSLGGVRPGVWWNPRVGKLELELGLSQSFALYQGSGIFGAIARELAFTVTEVGGLALCSGCGLAYTPKRKPRADRLNFCQRCNESGVPAKLAKRRQRARQAG